MFDDAASVWELIDRRADASPDRVMLIDGDRRTTFAEYRELVLAAAAGYHDLGVDAGTNVSWQLPTWTESAVLVGALCRLGAVQNPMLPIYRYRPRVFPRSLRANERSTRNRRLYWRNDSTCHPIYSKNA